ncbi:hypothetical protein MKW98_009299 [Papaver atlanticum]|uniref:Uncharacterized protein n=1 Tax=Papaver atlanticum TaxID=357466 RepID=A0AAD4XCK5_9MAGN|nr:hypothetical protein MKW98_009299 [Papaver atlanticum]
MKLDLGMLLEVAVMYDRRISARITQKRRGWFLMSLTGKKVSYTQGCYSSLLGPEKEKKHEEQIKRLPLKRVAFRTMSLAAEDYPLLLGLSRSNPEEMPSTNWRQFMDSRALLDKTVYATLFILSTFLNAFDTLKYDGPSDGKALSIIPIYDGSCLSKKVLSGAVSSA